MTTILKEIATSNSEPAIQIISNIVSNTEFFTKIVLPLIKTPLFDDSSYLIFLNDLIVIFTKIFDKFSNLHNLLPINDISPTVDLLLISFAKGIIKYDKQIIDTIKSNSDILKQKNLLSLFTKVEDQQREKENKIEELKNVPIDYYDKSPIITSDELQDNFRLPIQQHRPKGSYESYERYFNTLFYLEYEDCYRSLKTSILNIKSTEANEMINVERENRDIYYYVNGEIVNIEVSPIGICSRWISSRCRRSFDSRRE